MAKIFLFNNEAHTAVAQNNTNDEYFGSAGDSDILKLGLNASTVPTALDADAQIERIEFTGNVADYTFKFEGNELAVSVNGTALAQINLGNNPTFAFADGSATMEITNLGQATFGGQAVPTDDTAFATAPTLDATDPSSNADATPPSNPNFTIADVTVAEDVGNAVVTITRDDATDAATIDVATAADTATDGTDYTALTETVTFAAGDTTATVNVAVIDDADVEGDETFNVNLANASIGTITDNQAVVTISANDSTFTTKDLGVGTTANVTGDNAVDEVFAFDVEAALATVDNTQVTITDFDVANDKLSINLANAIGSTTLDQLTTDATVQSNPITQTTLVNFGPDANGDIVTLTLAGLTDATAVDVDVI